MMEAEKKYQQEEEKYMLWEKVYISQHSEEEGKQHQIRIFWLQLLWLKEKKHFQKMNFNILKQVGFLWNRTVVVVVDKLSFTSVDFIRSEGN